MALFRVPRRAAAGAVFKVKQLAEWQDQGGKPLGHVTCPVCDKVVAGATCVVKSPEGVPFGACMMADTRLGFTRCYKLKGVREPGTSWVVKASNGEFATEDLRVPFVVSCRRCDAVIDQWPRKGD